MPILPGTSLTGGSLLVRLAESCDDLLFSGTSTNGTTTSVVATAIPSATDDDPNFEGAWFYGISGQSVAEERIISDFKGTTSTLTPLTAITDPDNGSTLHTDFLLTRRNKPSMYLRALQAAQRYETQKGTALLKVTGREGVVGNLVPNGMFDLYTTANVPDNITLDTNSTFTMETTITGGARRALKGVTDGSNAGYVRAALTGWGKFAGRSVQCWARVRTSAYARTTLQWDDGVTQTTASPTASNAWQLINLSAAFGTAATKGQVSVEISAGSAVTFYVQLLYVPDPLPTFEYAPIDSDRSLIYIGDLKVSNSSALDSYGGGYDFGDPLRLKNFSVVEDTEDTPRKLRLDCAGSYRGRVVEYVGWKNHAELTGPTISYTGNPEMLLARAKYYVLMASGADQNDIDNALREADRTEKALAVRVDLAKFRRVQAS